MKCPHCQGTGEIQDEAPKFDFESLYLKYPRKIGKTLGIRSCKSKIKTQEQFDKLSLAIDNYKRIIAYERRELKFVKHFNSFMSIWEDYAVEPPKPKPQALGPPPDRPDPRTGAPLDPKVKAMLNNILKRP